MSVSWLPFFLRPNTPAEGKRKGGTPASRVGSWLQRINAKEGPAIKFTGMCDTHPNTTLYHIALSYVKKVHGAKAQNRCAGRIFKGYFQDGIFPDKSNLIKLCREVLGSEIDTAALSTALSSEGERKSIVAEARQLSRDYQVTGVPFFIIQDKFSLSGAQESEAFLRTFAQV